MDAPHCGLEVFLDRLADREGLFAEPPGDSIAQEFLHERQIAACSRPIVPITVDRAGDEQHTTTAMPQVVAAGFGVLDEQRAPLDDGRVPDRQPLLRRLYAGF